MKFQCRVINENEDIVDEIIYSDNENNVYLELKNKNYKIISIEEFKENKIDKKDLFVRKIKKDKLQLILYQLYILTSSNITIPKSIELISKDINSKYNYISENILNDINKGISLSNAIEKQKTFPDLVISMIKVGEESSNLSEVFKNLSDFYKEEIIFEKNIKSALYYPMLLIIVTFLIVNFLAITVLPNFTEIFYSNEMKLPLITRILVSISNFLSNNLIMINIVFVLFLLFLFGYSKSKEGKYKIDKIKLKSNLYREIKIKRFSTLMKLLLKSNLTMYESLKIVENSMGNLVIKEDINKICENIRKGDSLSNSLNKTKNIPNILISLIKVAEESSKTKETFETLEKYYTYNVKVKQKNFITFLEPMIIIILSIIVGFVVIAIAVPMFDVVNRI